MGNVRYEEWVQRCGARVGGTEYGQGVSDQRSEVRSNDQGFRSKDWRVRNNRVRYYKQRYFDQRVLFDY